MERKALAAHRRGLAWGDFWLTVAAKVGEAEPYSRERFRRLRDRLLHLVVSGDGSGEYPIDGELCPWDVDGGAKPHDTITKAKCQLPLRPLPTRAR